MTGQQPIEPPGKRPILVQAALEVFSKQGFAATRVSDIAEYAGVGKGTVYEYFSSKEELFFEVFEWFNQEIRSRVDAELESTSSARDVLLAILRSSAELITEHREIFSMNLDFWAASRGSTFEDRFSTACRQLYREYRGVVADVIRRGQQEGEFRPEIDPELLAALVVSALDGLGVQCWFDAAVDPIPATESFADALLNGMSPEDP
jgi:AcrR family transcriptional regulator